MAREDEEEEDEEEIVEEESSSSSSSPASPKATLSKEFAQSVEEEQSSTDDIDLASSVVPNLNLTQNLNHNLNKNLNKKPNIEDDVTEIESTREDMEELQRAEPATIIVSPHNGEEMVVGRMELSPVMEGSPSPEPNSKQARALSPVSAPIERSPSLACLPTEGSLSPEQSLGSSVP